MCVALLLFAGHDASAQSSIDVIKREIRAHQARLLKIPGGVEIHYRVDVVQPEDRPHFLFRKGLDGVFVSRWPQIRCREEGPFSGYNAIRNGKTVSETRDTIREGAYDFALKLSFARDNAGLSQISPYRHGFSTHCYVLKGQFFEQMNQRYELQADLESDFLLPCALSSDYVSLSGGYVNGVPCTLASRSGLDRIWIAESHGYTVCKREFHFSIGGPIRDRMVADDLREITAGVWLPMRQVTEKFDQSGDLLYRLNIKVTRIVTGRVTDEDLYVDLSKNNLLQDQVNGGWMRSTDAPNDRFEKAIQQVTHSAAQRRLSKTRYYVVLALFFGAVVISGTVATAFYRSRGGAIVT
jgi:hypothetical protein